MQQYLRRGAMSGVLNMLGLRLALAAAALGWFIWLWGLTPAALLAGTALGVLLQLALTRWSGRAAERKEESLRRALGGEMALENLTLCEAKQAHLQAALLLCGRYPLSLHEATEDGVLCFLGEELLLVRCLARPSACEAGCEDAAALQRACRAHKADRGVLCLTCKCGGKLRAYAEEGPVPVRIISRETMLALAGAAAPATDEQLVALKARKKRRLAQNGFRRTLLHPSKARRYMGYGLGLMLLSIVTGLRYYPVPGALCMGLAALCRCQPKEEERL